MSSLTAQLELLKKEQAILAEKIKQEEILKRNQELTLERLEKLNEMQKEAIKKYKSKDGKYRGKYELQQTNLMTSVPSLEGFEVFLEILKKQDERIKALENSN